VPHVALRLWNGDPATARAEFPADERRGESFRPEPRAAVLLRARDARYAQLFGESSDHLRSFAYISLRSEQTFGLLVLASEDAQRFYPEMGTLHLKRLGDLASAMLQRHLAGA